MARTTDSRPSETSRTASSRQDAATSSRSVKSHFVLWSIIGALVFVLDQTTKFWFESKLELCDVIYILPCFNFVLAHNYGAAFSFLAGMGGWQRWLFSGIAVIVVFFIVKFLRHFRDRTLLCLSLTLLGAGAMGNLCDRIFLGYVIDFIDLHYGIWHWPAFNIADIAICMGAAGVVMDGFIPSKSNH